MQIHRLGGECELIQQSILNRYPLVLVECFEGMDAHVIRLRLRPDSPLKEVQITTQEYVDGTWEQAVDLAVRDLYAM